MFCRRAAVHNARRFTVFIKKGCVLMVDLRENEVKDAVFEKIDFLAREAFELNYFLAENPELSGKEYLACEKICALLESHGITVERAFAGIPTAFRGTVCEAPDSGINIGIIAEYDALPEIGHACGHCASGSLSLLAALALHECADLVPANIDIIGTPDEEATGKKIEMAEAGLFDKYDFVIMIHMDSKNKAEMKLLALSAFHYNFRGQPAHASACPWAGKNALNGAMLMIHGFDMMRQHLKPTTRVHGIIIRGGEASNIVPEYASAEYTFRSPDSRYLAQVVKLLHDCAKGAAMATQTSVEIVKYAPSLDSMKLNPAGTAMLEEIFAAQGLPVFKGEDENIGSSDIGNVSFRCAAFHPTISISDEDIPCHTREFAAKMKEKDIERVISTGARIICEMAVRSVYEPERLEAIRRDFRK